MLAPVTKKAVDHSTDEWFRFTFCCDICGSAWESDRYAFSMRDSPAESEGERRARALFWRCDHDAAYERANNEAILHFNKCRRCGAWVCDDCFGELTGLCRVCGESGREERSHEK